MDKIADLVTGEAVLQWLIIFLLIAYFVYKEYPEFKKRMTGGTKREMEEENRERGVEERVTKLESRIADIEGKLKKDYISLEELLKAEQEDKRILQASLEEREITMRALLAIIDGLHEIGANGPTTAAHEELTTYLSKQAHRGGDPDVEREALRPRDGAGGEGKAAV